MTVIAYRNGIFATDRMVSKGDTEVEGNKMFIHPYGPDPDKEVIIAIQYTLDKSIGLMNWYLEGADPFKLYSPQYLRKDNDADHSWCGMVIWDGDRLLEYENCPISVDWTNSEYMAWGSGREVAIGAFCQGATSIEAVRSANKHAQGCGFGVNFVNVNKKPYKLEKYLI